VLGRLSFTALVFVALVACEPKTSVPPNADGAEVADDGVGVCLEPPTSDAFRVEGLGIDDDVLDIEVSYAGGCELHEFTSCWSGSFDKSLPVQAHLWLDHDAHVDSCEALKTETLHIDIMALRDAFTEAQQTDSGTIVIHVQDRSIEYYF
jgi:hypothetical protein